MKKLILRLVINALALYAAAALLPGIEVLGGWTAFAAMAVIFGVVNAVVRPIIKLLTCPLIILTLGLFVLVVNGLMLMLAARLGSTLGVGFHIQGLGAGIVGALVVSVASWALSLLVTDE